MSLIDKPTFEQLKQISGADFINELIEAFLEDGPTMIGQMQIALATRDVESFRRNAHSLKSNANTFGATTLGVLARELEMLARANDLDIGDKLETLKEAFERVAAELQEMRT